jgi:hypothetical protein
MVRYYKAIFVVIFGISSFGSAEVIFEAYSKVFSGGVHAGFTISRYEFDTKKKQFTFTSFLKTNALAGNVMESIQATSKADLTPIQYSYTSLQGIEVPGTQVKTEVKTIDAKFAKGKMTADVKVGGKITKIKKDLPKGTFLSYFLVYAILNNPKGMTEDTKYEYQAIAEEDAEIVKGVAYVKSIEDQNGMKVYKVLNDFKNMKFVSYITKKGEILSTKSPADSIGSEVVAQSSSATAGFQIPTSLIQQLFGSIPLGTTNPISSKGDVKHEK